MNRKKILKLTALSLAVYTSSNLVDVGSIIARADDTVVQTNQSNVNNNEITEENTNDNSSKTSEENTQYNLAEKDMGSNSYVTTSESVDISNKDEEILDNKTLLYAASAEKTNENVIYSNDFSDDAIPNEVHGVISQDDVSIEKIGEDKALKIKSKFDGTDNWDSNKHELIFYADSSDEIPSGSIIQFDVLIPEDKANYEGIIKYSGGIGDKAWNWKGAGYGDINAGDFKDEGNGYLRKTVSVKTSDTSDGLKKVVVQLSGYNCEYKGDIYIDNVKLIKGKEKENLPSKETTIYSKDFSDDAIPNEVDGVISQDDVSIEKIGEDKALKIKSKFDGTDNWDSNKHELIFYADSSDEIPSGSIIQFDVLIPEDKANYEGIIKYSGGIGDKAWNWKGAGYGDINAGDFKDEGNGYLRKTVSVKTSDTSDGLKKVVVQLSGYNCQYAGDIYIDNVKLIKVEAGEEPEIPAVEPITWTFDDSDEGWSYGGQFQYAGTEEVNFDSEHKALRLGVDYSKNVGDSWSEFKIENKLDSPISLNGYNVLKYDFIFNPKSMTTGSIKTKLFIDNGPNKDVAIDLANAEDLGNGLKKAQVTIGFDNFNIDVNSITIGIVGSSTDYKGQIYIDNITLDQEAKEDIYVEKTAVPIKQDIVSMDTLNMPASVKLVDDKASKETADLYAYLEAIGKSDKVIYGHQNDTHKKAVYHDGTESDTKDITGSISGIVGIDALSLTGDELELTDGDEGKTVIQKAAEIGKKASAENAILTMSAHMPNFAKVLEKGKDAEGKYDYSGYSPNVTSGNIVSRIMPGGDLNEVYTGYLDMIAEYAHELGDTPVLFRPFHENNGSWFWWGGAYCDAQAYRNLFAYTVDYLKDTKNVHNFLYVYSPNGPFENEEEYLSRYPGDEYIDILAFDMYHDDPMGDASKDPWMKSFKETIDLVQGIADSKNKLSAVSETGIRIDGGGMPITGNPNKTWFKDVSDIISESNMPYYMVWANFNNSDNFFAPFMVNDKKGHEMINDFINYYNDEKTVFADRIDDYSEADTQISDKYAYGYIMSPISNDRILEPITIKASVKNAEGKVTFNIKNKEGKVLKTIEAKNENGTWAGDITQDLLNELGQTSGVIELQCNDIVLNHINAIFNIKDQEKQPRVVDDFESYMGDSSLLAGAWSTNKGPGCSVNPKLSQDNKYKGEYGLAFNYKISTERTSEGYAGIIKSLEADWTGCDALQLWAKPDGKGQKLVIQLTSNGEDFEVRLPEFTKTTEAKLLTLPFSDFVGKKGGKLDVSNITSMAIYCNTIVPEGHVGGWTVDSSIYFDEIKAINTKDQSNENNNNNNSGSSSSSSSHKKKNNDKDKDEDKNKVEDNKKVEEGNKEDKKTGWQKNENGEWHYIQADGTKKIGWLQDTDGKWYYLQINGIMKTGWLQDTNGSWYYLEADGAMKKGWLQDTNGSWYYLEADGAMKKGWFKDTDGRWYYLQSNGAMKTGWFKDTDGRWYYLQSNGEMKTGWFKDANGKWYYLKENGSMAINEVINGYKVNNNGEWIN